ncbi:hypothetical protein SUNI508_13254 [Seiridium unicorne]|uniref:Berberine/berberine-like domain-containing protein n=1 Tax=Seiridium unicorne TaxID=138068 RepID=A0ABR2VDJ8_9PEZI
MDNLAAPCQHSGLANWRSPIDQQQYDPQAMRKEYDSFGSAMKETPALNGSFFLSEGYSLAGVKAVPSEMTAYANRDGKFLASPVMRSSPPDTEAAQAAAKLRNELRSIFYEASGQTKLHAYVNYAFGNESKQNWYGYEQWRQDKLLAMKKKHDHQRKFSLYAPTA